MIKRKKNHPTVDPTRHPTRHRPPHCYHTPAAPANPTPFLTELYERETMLGITRDLATGARAPYVSSPPHLEQNSWWVDGTDDQAVATKLSEAAAAAIAWARDNGVAFDHGKTEAAIFQRMRRAPTATVTVGPNEVPFNREATRWLGVWPDSQLTFKSHHATRMKEG